MVLIRRFNSGKGRGIKSFSIIKTPEKVGAVKITGYEGLILTLTSENGDVFKFDIASEKFVFTPILQCQAAELWNPPDLYSSFLATPSINIS